MRRGISGGGKKTYAVLGKALSGHVVVLSLQYAENTGYYPIFSLRDSMIEAFFGGFLWSFKK